MHHDLDIHPIPEKVLYIKNTPGSDPIKKKYETNLEYDNKI